MDITHVSQTKQFRVDLDATLQKLKLASNEGRPSQGFPEIETRISGERSIAITKIQEAIMWLGMDLKALNEPNPYPNSYKPENQVIEQTADGLKL